MFFQGEVPEALQVQLFLNNQKSDRFLARFLNEILNYSVASIDVMVVGMIVLATMSIVLRFQCVSLDL